MKLQATLAWMTALCLTLASPPAAFAELPVLNEAPWLGYFAGHEGRRFKFGITGRGEIKLTPLNDKGLAFGPHMVVPIQAGIEEVLPDGKVEMKTLRVDTLESKQSATDKLDRVVIQGKVSAEAVFEVIIEQKHGTIFIGGRLLDPGQFKKNPVRFVVRVKVPNTHPWTKEASWKSDPAKVEAFLRKIEGDSIELNRIDRKRLTWTFDKPVDASTNALTGPGVSRLELRMQSFGERRFLFDASEHSMMSLANTPGTALHEGFTITWIPDPAKDRDGKARLGFTVK